MISRHCLFNGHFALQILVQAHQSPPKVSVAELLQQLTVTQAELENIKVRCELFSSTILFCVEELQKHKIANLLKFDYIF